MYNLLYFTHVKKIHDLSPDDLCIVIDREDIMHIDLGLYNVEVEPTLAPPLLLEALYNDEKIDRGKYIREYFDYLKHDLRARCAIHELRKKIDKQVVTLLFMKNDIFNCFRDVLKVYLESEGIMCEYIY